jgi:hypothetical protein
MALVYSIDDSSNEIGGSLKLAFRKVNLFRGTLPTRYETSAQSRSVMVSSYKFIVFPCSALHKKVHYGRGVVRVILACAISLTVLLGLVFFTGGNRDELKPRPEPQAQVIGYKVVREYAHDTEAFTQAGAIFGMERFLGYARCGVDTFVESMWL